MAIIRGKETGYTRNLTEFEKSLGIDLKLTETNDLELTNLGDFSLVSGVKNASQAVKIRMFLETGGLLYHPEIGTDLGIGEKTADAMEIKMQVIQSLGSDTRFDKVEAKVDVLGNTILVDTRLTLRDTGIEVPFQFSVVR